MCMGACGVCVFSRRCVGTKSSVLHRTYAACQPRFVSCLPVSLLALHLSTYASAVLFIRSNVVLLLLLLLP